MKENQQLIQSTAQCAARTPKSSAQRGWICWNRSHRNRSSSPERVRLLQPLLPRPPPQKRQRPATYSRSQTLDLRPDEKVVQDDHFEKMNHSPEHMVHVAGPERRILSHPGSPPMIDDSWDSHSKGWHINTRSCRLGYPWLPSLLHDAWMQLSPLCDRSES